ncbi:MAG TPA: hypothetical protein VNP92_18315 [Actinophytocola sp.]|nr:hypothetical protein [Actinophytocola sp.]
MTGRWPRQPVYFALLAALASIAACSASEGPQPQARNDGVDGPVIAAVKDQDAFMEAVVGGQLRLVDGCLLLGDTVVTWPHKTTWDQERNAVVFAGDFEGYAEVDVGEVFRGAGGYVDEPAELSPEGEEAIRRCWTATRTSGLVVAHPE